MKRTLWIVLFSCCFLLFSALGYGANEDYRLGPGDTLGVSFWIDGVEGLQQQELTIRPDGKLALSFGLVQYKDYRLGPGDILSINVWSVANFADGQTVRTDGKITIPLVGEIEVSGLTPTELTKNLTQDLSAYIKNPVVTVIVTKSRQIPVLELIPANGLTLEELTAKIKTTLNNYMKDPQVNISIIKMRTVRIYVLGEVKDPGLYEIVNSHNILDAIGSAHGYTKYANKKEIYIVRKETGSYQRANLNALLKKGDLTQNYLLSDGDLVYVSANGIKFVEDVLPYISTLYQLKHFNDN